MVFSILFFIIVILITFYFPGRFFLRFFGFRQDSLVILTASALTVGITFFLLLLYIFSWFGIPLVATIVVFLLSLFEIRLLGPWWKKNIKEIKIFSFQNILLIIGSCAMTSVMWLSGSSLQSGLAFYSVNTTDGFYHLSLIGSLMHSFPPVHPGLADIPLRGYHFFYDLLIAHFVNVYNFNKLDLFFRLFPFFVSLFYGIAGLSVARFFNFSSITTNLFIFLLYFAQGFTSFLRYFFSGNYDTKIIQSVAHSPDPNVIFSLALLFSFFTLLFSSKTIFQFIFIGVLIGVMPNVKIYTAIILFGALFFVSLAAIVKKRDFKFLITLIIGGLIGALIYLPINYGAGQLIFAPFLLYKHFMESSSMFANFQWGLKYQIYEAHNNYIRIASLYGMAMLLFFIPSLGLRLVTLVDIPKLFNKKFYTLENIFWITAITITFIIPTFFIQSVAVFVIVQFLWFGYVLLLLPTAVSLGKLLRNASFFARILLSCVLVLLSIPDTFNIIKIYTKNPYVVNADMVKITKHIENNVPLNSGLIVLNRQQNPTGFSDMYTIPLFSGLTNHPIYYEPEVLEFRGLEAIIQKRRETIDTVQEITYTTCDTSSMGKQQVIDILKETKNQYILTLQKNDCLDRMQIFKKISEEGQVTLYKLL